MIVRSSEHFDTDVCVDLYNYNTHGEAQRASDVSPFLTPPCYDDVFVTTFDVMMMMYRWRLRYS